MRVRAVAGVAVTTVVTGFAGMAGAAPSAAPTVYERTSYVMGTLLTVRVSGAARSTAEAAVEAALAEVRRLEGVLSSWTPDSEIGRINAAAAGESVALSAELAALLHEAGQWVAATGGAFDPAVGALIDAWDLRGAGRQADAAELQAAVAATGWGHALLSGGTLRRGPSGWWLDTGAFGKGAALRAAARALADAGVLDAVLDFGGQLLVLGSAEQVAVAHPVERGTAAARLRLSGVSAATTSSSERFVLVDGTRLGHVLDPRRGTPVRAWGSVTVVTSDPLEADALSTALYVMGPAAALRWAEDRGKAVLLVLEPVGGRVRARWTRAMAPFVVESTGDFGT